MTKHNNQLRAFGAGQLTLRFASFQLPVIEALWPMNKIAVFLAAIFTASCSLNEPKEFEGSTLIDAAAVNDLLGIKWHSGLQLSQARECSSDDIEGHRAKENPADFESCFLVTISNSSRSQVEHHLLWYNEGIYIKTNGMVLLEIVVH